MTDPASLGELGWTPALAATLPPGSTPARVVAQHRGEFAVATGEGEIRVRAPRRLIRSGQDVAVGDWVALREERIEAVLPRHSALTRQAAGNATVAQTLAANIDIAFLVSSLGPDLEPRRIERYLVAIWESGARPEIVLNKADRAEETAAAVAAVESVAPGVPVHVVSALTGVGCAPLRERLGPGVTGVLLGSSGVGKSTLVNRFAGKLLMSTGPTREDDDKGRHTTTHRQLLVLPGGGLIIDTPGLREFQLWESDPVALAATFSDLEELAATCRFNDCSHTKEPGCAVTAAVASGDLTPERLASWRDLQKELDAIIARQGDLIGKVARKKWKALVAESEGQVAEVRRKPR